MNPVFTVLPKQSAAVILSAAHVVDGALFAKEAALPSAALTDRLDSVLKAANAFDHAVTASKGVPLQWVWGGARQAYRGYALANQVIELALAARIVPDLSDRVAAVQLGESARELRRAAGEWNGSGRSKFESYRSGGWVGASSRDALEGATFIRNMDLVRGLAGGYQKLNAQLSKRGEMDAALAESMALQLEAARPALVTMSADTPRTFSPEIERAIAELAAFAS